MSCLDAKVCTIAGVAALGLATTSAFIFKRKVCLPFINNSVSVEVTTDDKGFGYFTEWLESQDDLQYLKNVEAQVTYAYEEEGVTETKRSIIPAIGSSEVNLRGRKIKLYTTRTPTSWGSYQRTLRMTIDGGDRNFLEHLVDEAKEYAEQRPIDRLLIYRSSCEGDWTKFGCPRRLRPLSTIFLDKGIAENLRKDLQDFLSSKQWYEERGVPYRRGFLFYGPPGCGKTSMVKALASELNYAICVLNLSNKKMTDDVLMQLMSVVPNKSFVLLEDVDAVFKNREVKTNDKDDDCDDCCKDDDDKETTYKVTFSGLLNTIDGVAAVDGRILFMTTNYLERLDAALIRPGRVDVKQLIDYPTDYQLEMIFSRFYPDASRALVQQFVQKASASQMKKSVAEIQGHFMMFKDDPEAAILSFDKPPAQ